MWVMPSSTTSRRTARAPSRSAGGPITPGPASCMAPYPNRVTVSPPIVQVPPGRVVVVVSMPMPRIVRGDARPTQVPGVTGTGRDTRRGDPRGYRGGRARGEPARDLSARPPGAGHAGERRPARPRDPAGAGAAPRGG